MIVAEFPLTLCRHPTLCLHHLLYFIGTILETLGSVEALGGGIGVNAGTVKLADGVVTLGHVASNATICGDCLETCARPSSYKIPGNHTVVRVRTAHHQGHGVPPGSSPQLSTLDEVVDGAIDLCIWRPR